MNPDLERLQKQIANFCEERDWDQFHDAKELSIGAVTEASELLEHFRFLSSDQVYAYMENQENRQAVGEELADVFFFLLRFCQRYDMDLEACFQQKMEKNAHRYPVGEFRGKNHKSSIE